LDLLRLALGGGVWRLHFGFLMMDEFQICLGLKIAFSRTGIRHGPSCTWDEIRREVQPANLRHESDRSRLSSRFRWNPEIR
jgi:hypothetical protein